MNPLPNTYPPPKYILNQAGTPQAVLLDLATWELILTYLEDVADAHLLQTITGDLETLAAGTLPSGWQPWEDFETELDKLALDNDLSN